MHSTVIRFGKNADSKQRNATPTQTLHFHVKFMYMPCYFSIYILYSVSLSYFFRFVSLKNVHLTVQVCCLFYFLLHNTLFKGKVRSGILVVFIVFF